MTARSGSSELRCVSCGYDLRGSQSSRCPECGCTRGAPRSLVPKSNYQYAAVSLSSTAHAWVTPFWLGSTDGRAASDFWTSYLSVSLIAAAAALRVFGLTMSTLIGILSNKLRFGWAGTAVPSQLAAVERLHFVGQMISGMWLLLSEVLLCGLGAMFFFCISRVFTQTQLPLGPCIARGMMCCVGLTGFFELMRLFSGMPLQSLYRVGDVVLSHWGMAAGLLSFWFWFGTAKWEGGYGVLGGLSVAALVAALMFGTRYLIDSIR